MNNEKQEVRYFATITMVILTLLFVIIKVSPIYANEVLVAEAPVNVGGSNENFSGSFIIDISNGGSGESIQSSAPAIIYATDSSGGNNPVLDIESGNDLISDTSQNNEVYGNSSEINIVVAEEPKSDTGKEQPEVTEAIYVPDSDDDCPVSSLVPLPIDVQQYIWTKCKRTTGDYKNYYAFILGAIQLESDFKRTAIHYNSNGTTDRGLMQINSCNISSCKRAGLITCTDDLWDIYKNIDCGFHEMDEYVKKFGVCESAYYAYNTGRQNGGSNKASRVVMKNMASWNIKIFG